MNQWVFSYNAKSMFGLPSYKNASFVLSETKTINIELSKAKK